jgi:hypothetical protein
MLKVGRSERMLDDVFVKLDSAIVLASAGDWNENEVRSVLQQIVAPGETASLLGASWRESGQSARSRADLDGLLPLSCAVRGKYLLLSNDSALLDEILVRVGQKRSSSEAATYLAGFNHASESPNFYRLASLIDQPSRNTGASEQTPEFFSDNIGTLSRSLGQELARESIEIHRNGNVETQAVRYQQAK